VPSTTDLFMEPPPAATSWSAGTPDPRRRPNLQPATPREAVFAVGAVGDLRVRRDSETRFGAVIDSCRQSTAPGTHSGAEFGHTSDSIIVL